MFQANISNFEIFHIKEKQIPVDIVELKEQVMRQSAGIL